MAWAPQTACAVPQTGFDGAAQPGAYGYGPPMDQQGQNGQGGFQAAPPPPPPTQENNTDSPEQ